jgi:hypothetical protein
VLRMQRQEGRRVRSARLVGLRFIIAASVSTLAAL